MSIFIGQLIGFAVIVFILSKWVVPLIKGLMVKQQEAIRVALAESAEAAKKLADADAMHAKALADAAAESSHVTDEARHDSERIKAQLAEQAGQDARDDHDGERNARQRAPVVDAVGLAVEPEGDFGLNGGRDADVGPTVPGCAVGEAVPDRGIVKVPIDGTQRSAGHWTGPRAPSKHRWKGWKTASPAASAAA